MIDFNRPAIVGNELKYIQDAVAQGMLCGDGKYTKLCSEWMKKRFDVNQVFLTTSCTHALEMAAFLCDIQPGDEVIMPSYTFVSTADAFVLRGAKIVFVDIRPDTMNIDENLIEQAITDKTRAIVPVHYAGVGCEMNKIMELAKKYNLKVVEDAGPNPCPPIVVGVGIGGTFDKAALLAKKALMRNTNVRNADPFYAQLEEEMLEKINALGIGPQGVGGKTTALAVNIEKMPTHIAGLPIAVNINCHVTRHKSVEL